MISSVALALSAAGTVPNENTATEIPKLRRRPHLSAIVLSARAPMMYPIKLLVTKGDRPLRNVELLGDHRERVRDRDDVEEGKEITRANDPQKLALVRPHRNAVETRHRTRRAATCTRSSRLLLTGKLVH